MRSDLVFYAFTCIVLIFLVFFCGRLRRSGKSAPAAPQSPRPKREPKPFAGLTRKPACDVCARESAPHPPAPGARSCPCGLRINRVCLSGATTRSSMVRPWPLPFGSQGLVKSTYPACGRRCSAQPYDRQPHSRLTALVAGATVARGTGAPLSGARHDRSGLLPWPAYRDATVWASHSRWWARAVVTVGVGLHAATRRYRRHEGSVANFDFRGKSENLVSAIQ